MDGQVTTSMGLESEKPCPEDQELYNLLLNVQQERLNKKKILFQKLSLLEVGHI